MAKMKCERPGCAKQVEAPDIATALEMLKLHDAQAHSIANKPEKPRRPELAMTGDAVEAQDWDKFVFMYKHYKTLAGVTKDSSSHLLECLSSDVYSILFRRRRMHKSLAYNMNIKININIFSSIESLAMNL